ncbi:MAG: S9 family peptidase [Sphingosinicella sp.]|nr:S9 family peptidase [Sphingosinicella sp.]
MRISFQTFAAILLSSTFPLHAAAETRDLARLFGARETIESVSLSPLGDYVSYKTPSGPRETSIITAEIATGKQATVVRSKGDEYRISDCTWAKNDRLVCAVEGETLVDNIKVGFTRTFAVSKDGTTPQQLGTRNTHRSLEINQYSGRVIDYLPDDPQNVLMQVPFIPEFSTDTRIAQRRSGLGVQKFNIYTGRASLFERPLDDATRFITDGRGEVRLRVTSDSDPQGRLTGTRRYWVRAKSGGEWKSLAVRTLDTEFFSPLAFDETGDSLYVLRPENGRDALVRLALDGSGKEEVVFAHPRVDVDSVVRFGRYGRPVGVRYFEEYQHIEYFDPNLKKLESALSKALPGKTVSPVDMSWDENRILIFAYSDTDSGTYYVLDRKTRELMPVSETRPELVGVPLAKTTPLTYPASDGAQVPGYLTLPVGSDGKNLPLVVMPHGGPESRDVWGFDWLAQFLAANGYAVLQPNFRGSSGYGAEWIGDNGFQGWQKAIGDINDGAHWAIKSGLANPQNVAIVGWSYGGYAALQANVVDPTLYKAAVAIAPVTDLPQMVEESKRYTHSRLVKNFVGTGPQLNAASPARNAAAIQAPVLLFHGTMDLNVLVGQSRRMESVLKNAGKSVEYVEYPGLQHSLLDSNARIDMLTRIGAFLKANVR